MNFTEKGKEWKFHEIDLCNISPFVLSLLKQIRFEKLFITILPIGRFKSKNTSHSFSLLKSDDIS